MAMPKRPDHYERCVNGHDYTPETMRVDHRGCLVCKVCSREAVRASYRKHRDKRRAEAKVYDQTHREQVAERKRRERRLGGESYAVKRRARDAVKEALKHGRLRRGMCEGGHGVCSGRIEAHHKDYTNPLDVMWLCSAHHNALHRGVLV